MKKAIHMYLPKYACIPLLMLLILNFVTYNCTKIITNSFAHYNISFWVDDFLPFVSLFIVVYLLAYIQWIVGFIVISRESKEFCYKFLSAEMIAKLFCFLFFFVFPTTMVRPEILGNSFLDFLTKMVYRLDEPVNLFPSIHCLESWLIFRATCSMKNVSKWYQYFTFVFSILVCLSTVFVKQHVVFDIVGGIVVVEIGIFLANKFRTGRIFEILNKKLNIGVE